MKPFVFVVLGVHMTIMNAFLEIVSATVHIENYDGPIYVHTDGHSVTCDHRNSGGIIPPDKNHPSSSCCPTLPNTPIDRYPTLPNLVPTSDQSVILHTIPHQSSETDCKCLTKHQSACVPVNNVQQNAHTPCSHVYVPQYEGYHGYLYPNYSYTELDASCPKISESLIPLLKTYLSQSGSKCPKHTCLCGHNHSS